jgi:hypothetical protein
MSPQDPQDTPANDASRVAVLEATVSKMSNMLEQVLQALGAKATPPATTVAAAQQLEQYPQQVASRYYDDEIDPDADYHVRIKPYDDRPNCPSGLRRRRMFVPEIGRPLDGGSGKPGDVPPWIIVKGTIAEQLMKYRQDPNDSPDCPQTPPVFDICTPEERAAIDSVESRLRMATLGMLGMTPQQALEEAAKPGQVTAQTRPLRRGRGRPPGSGPRPPQREAPTLVQGAEQFVEHKAEIPAARSKALQGLPPAPPPPAPPAPVQDTDDGDDASQLEAMPPQRKRRSRLDVDIERASEAFGGQVTGRALSPKQ